MSHTFSSIVFHFVLLLQFEVIYFSKYKIKNYNKTRLVLKSQTIELAKKLVSMFISFPDTDNRGTDNQNMDNLITDNSGRAVVS